MNKSIVNLCNTVASIGSPEDLYSKQDSLLFIERLRERSEGNIKYVTFTIDNEGVPALVFDFHLPSKGFNEVFRVTLVSLETKLLIGFREVNTEYVN